LHCRFGVGTRDPERLAVSAGLLRRLFAPVFGLFGVLWLLPREISEIEVYVNDVMRTSSWFLGTGQALVIVVVGKFFLEDLEEEGAERGSQITSDVNR
jgi:hypothetical protein